MLKVIALIGILVALAALRLHAPAEGAVGILVGTIDVALVAATVDVAVTVGHARHRTYLATVDMHLGLTEDKAVGVQLAVTAQVVAASATTIDVTSDMGTVHLDVGLAGTVDAFK